MGGADGINGVRGAALKPQDFEKKDPQGLKKALTEFESVFINQMLKTMRESVVKSDLLHSKTSGEDVYNSLFDMEISKLMAAQGGIGLEKAFIRQLEMQNGGAAPKDPVQDDVVTPGQLDKVKKAVLETMKEKAPTRR